MVAQDGSGPAGGTSTGPSAATLLEVADGLRWRDPHLSAALAEHAARLAGDEQVRGAAQRSAARALGELDHAAEIVGRAVPLLRTAAAQGRRADVAALRCDLAGAALLCGDHDLARRLVEPLGDGAGLPTEVRVEVAVRSAQWRAALGRVAAVDDVAARARTTLDPVPGPARVDLERARAAARAAAGDPAAAADVLGALDRGAGVDGSGSDGGRRAAYVALEHVTALLDQGDMAAAGRRAGGALAAATTPSTTRPLGLLRTLLAHRAHAPAGDWEGAERLARAAESDLRGQGHDGDAARATSVLAGVAEARGELREALELLRSAHAGEREAGARHERALRAVVEVIVDVPVDPTTADARGGAPTRSDGSNGRATGSAGVAPDGDGPTGDGPTADGGPEPAHPGRPDGAPEAGHRDRAAREADRDEAREPSMDPAAAGSRDDAAREPAGSEPAGSEPAGSEPAGSEPAGSEPAGFGAGGPEAAGPGAAAPGGRRSRRRAEEDADGDAAGPDAAGPDSATDGRPDDAPPASAEYADRITRENGRRGGWASRTGRSSRSAPDAFSTAPAAPAPAPAPAGDRDRDRDGSAPDGPDRSPPSGPDGTPSGSTSARSGRRHGRPGDTGALPAMPPHVGVDLSGVGGLADDLPLTLAGLLAEYDLPDASDGTSTSAPAAAERPRRSDPGPAAASTPPLGSSHDARVPPVRTGSVDVDGDSGARLADLLAEAMDAFRRTAPDVEDRPNGVRR